ncbi:hypothetical protein EDD16DRAFT_1519194 [Pisolithus croceorrhizus]|nr:hypothetical protein EDD16DRAFT_1519194 [Pisolithus croceorrhizus]
MVPAMPVFRSLIQHWMGGMVSASTEVHMVVYQARTTDLEIHSASGSTAFDAPQLMQWLSCAGPSPPGHFNPSDRVAFDFEDALYIQSSSFLKYSVPGMTILSTCPNNGVPGRCNNEVSAAKPTGNKSTWAAQNPRWPVMQPHQSLSTVEKEHCSAHAASRQISAAQQKDHDALLNKAIQSLADEFEAKATLAGKNFPSSRFET